MFENDLHRLAARRPPRSARRPPSSASRIDLYQPFRDFEAVARRQLERNLRRAEAKFDVMERARRRPDARLLERLARRDRRRRPRRRAAAPRSPSGRPTRGLRIAYEALAWGRHVERVRPRLAASSQARRPPRARRLPGQLPHPLARHRPRRRSPRSRREKLFFLQLADAPHLRHGRAAVEPALPLLPRPGRLRPRRASLARVLRRRLRRAAVARGLQRRLPPGRPGADGRRRDALAADPRGGTHARRATRRARAPRAAPRARGYAFVELAVEPASVGETQRAAARARLRAAAPAPHQAGDAVARRATARRAAQRRRAGRRRGVAAIAVESADPARLGAARRGAARPDPRARPRARRGRPRRPSPRPTGRRSSSAAPTPRTPTSWLRGLRPARPGAAAERRGAGRAASTTSRWRSRSTTSTRRRCSTARSSGWSRARASSSPRPTGWCAAAR